MSLIFDQEKQFNYIYRYISSAFETTNLAGSTAFDLFPDTAGVDDAIYFGRYNPCWSFHDLKFNIGTALAATSITIVWEYLKNGTWTEIPNVVDNTNAFQNTGVNTVAFDVPDNMCNSSSHWSTRINDKDANWIRARITAVDGLTEGGATQTDTVKYKDFTITATDETLTLADLQSASDSGNWLARTGVPAVETTGKYTIIRPHMYWNGSTSFSETMKMIELGEENYPAGFRSSATGVFQLGSKDTNGKGDKGCYLYMHARFDNGYDGVNNFQAYASVVRRRTGDYGAFEMNGVFKFVDSAFISDRRWYLPGGVAAGSEWTRSLYADPDLLYLYSAHLAIDTFKVLSSWQGVLCGGSAVISNTDINNKYIERYYSASIDLIDCINIDRSKITSTAPSSGADRHVRIKYNINLQVLDEHNSPIENATVILKDVNGAESFNTTTGSDGKIAEQTVIVYDKWWEYANSWALHEDDYNDFTLEISADRYQMYVQKITIAKPIDFTITLNDAIPTYFDIGKSKLIKNLDPTNPINKKVLDL